MKTTFIFHGGGGFSHEKTEEDNADFYVELLRHVPQNGKVLQVLFAKDSNRVDSAIQLFNRNIDKYKNQKNIILDIASEENFIEQIYASDVLFIHGGVSLKLLNVLKCYSDLEQVIEGKVVSGVSAGMNVWAKYFYSPHANEVFEGLGVLPIKTIPHYKDEYKDKLKDIGADLEEVLLPEHTFRVFYK